jgi:hypothetical protein
LKIREACAAPAKAARKRRRRNRGIALAGQGRQFPEPFDTPAENMPVERRAVVREDPRATRSGPQIDPTSERSRSCDVAGGRIAPCFSASCFKCLINPSDGVNIYVDYALLRRMNSRLPRREQWAERFQWKDGR